jgi:hypothetical protein
MKWLKCNPDLAGNVGTLLWVTIILGVLAAGVTFLPVPQRNVGAGLGPEWECTAPPQGGPVCIKKLGR